jgi:hypothetical protein
VQPVLAISIAKLGTKKERRKKSVARWEFMGVFVGVLPLLPESWEFNKNLWEFYGSFMGVF